MKSCGEVSADESSERGFVGARGRANRIGGGIASSSDSSRLSVGWVGLGLREMARQKLKKLDVLVLIGGAGFEKTYFNSSRSSMKWHARPISTNCHNLIMNWR